MLTLPPTYHNEGVITKSSEPVAFPLAAVEIKDINVITRYSSNMAIRICPAGRRASGFSNDRQQFIFSLA